MTTHKHAESYRVKVLRAALICSFGIVLVQATRLHIIPKSADELAALASSQYVEEHQLSPFRGTIFDRRGDPLAISVRAPSICVNPRQFSPTQDETRELARILKISAESVRSVTQRKSHFAWLKRKARPEEAQAVAALGMKGVFSLLEPMRSYPGGSLAANLIGAVGADDHGLFGIERAWDSSLRGPSAKLVLLKDARGRPIFHRSDLATPETRGNDLYLTLDSALQEITDRQLRIGVENAKGRGGLAIVADPHTGRILAMSSFPTFDPNDLKHLALESTRSKAQTDVFEPGSVVKPLVIAAALESNKTTLQARHECEGGTLRIGDRVIRDDHPEESLSTLDTLVFSNNICTYKIAQRLAPSGLEAALRGFGLGGTHRSLSLTSEQRGSLSPSQSWPAIRFANIAFGQGMTTSALELVRAFGAIANGGLLMRSIVVDHLADNQGQISSMAQPESVARVLSPRTASIMRQALREVVTRGTGSQASTTRYSTAGKTGTAEKVDPKTKRYAPDKRIASFVGFAPAMDPHLVVYVAIDEPKEKPYYGGLRAAPVFAAIVDESLRYLNVAPDLEETASLSIPLRRGDLGAH